MRPDPGRWRVVFDCNTFVQAFAFENGPAAACFDLFDKGRIELFVSKPTIAELRRVLTYKEVLSLSSNLTSARIGALLDRIAFRATLMRRVRHVMDYPRDPNDQPYINLAIAARADFLVSRDKDLLSLMSGNSAICRRFRQLSRPMQVVNPVAFLAAVSAKAP